MLSEQSTIFPKQIKLDDYESSQKNSLIILESSNLLLGTGSRTSNAAIILAKALHYLKEEGEICFEGKSVLDIGCGVGLVGLYLTALGANVSLCDLPALRDLAEKNININRQMLKGKIEFVVGSWKKTQCIGGDCKKQGQNESETISTSSSSKTKESCLYHLSKNHDLTLICECGGLPDLQNQLKLMGKEGMILAFMKRENWDDGLDERAVDEYLNEKLYEYEKIQTYHPDYVDRRVSILRIYPLSGEEDANEGQEMVEKQENEHEAQYEKIKTQEEVRKKVQKLQISSCRMEMNE